MTFAIKKSYFSSVAVRIASPNAFACTPLHSGQCYQKDKCGEKSQRAYFLYILVIPYFLCFILSFVCALYVVKALLNQVRKDNKVCTKKSALKIMLQIYFA